MPDIIRPAFLFWGMAERYDDPVLRFAQELELQAAKRVEGFLTGKHKALSRVFRGIRRTPPLQCG